MVNLCLLLAGIVFCNVLSGQILQKIIGSINATRPSVLVSPIVATTQVDRVASAFGEYPYYNRKYAFISLAAAGFVAQQIERFYIAANQVILM